MDQLSVTVLGSGAVLILVGLSAFFSSSETAIFTLPKVDLDAEATSSDRRRATLADLRSDPHRLLVTILVGNNVVNMAIASITTVLVTQYLSTGVAVSVATVLASSVVLVFGEIVPKSYGLGHAREWALTVAGPIAAVELALYPLVIVFDITTRRLNRQLGGDTELEEHYLNE